MSPYRIETFVLIEQNEPIIFDTREEAERELEDILFLQPEEVMGRIVEITDTACTMLTSDDLKLEAQCRAQEYMEQHGREKESSKCFDWSYPINYAYFMKEELRANDYYIIHLTRVHCQLAIYAECWISSDGIHYISQSVHKIGEHVHA